MKSQTHLTSKKKLKSIAYIDNVNNVSGDKKHNMVKSINTINGVLSADPTEKLNETGMVSQEAKNQNLSLLEISRLTQFSQLSPLKTEKKSDTIKDDNDDPNTEKREKNNLEFEQKRDQEALDAIQKEYAKVNIRI